MVSSCTLSLPSTLDGFTLKVAGLQIGEFLYCTLNLPSTLEGFTLKVAELQIGECLYSLPSTLEGFTLKVAELQIGECLYSKPTATLEGFAIKVAEHQIGELLYSTLYSAPWRDSLSRWLSSGLVSSCTCLPLCIVISCQVDSMPIHFDYPSPLLLCIFVTSACFSILSPLKLSLSLYSVYTLLVAIPSSKPSLFPDSESPDPPIKSNTFF